MCLDELRRLRPGLGFALYALDAVGPVTLEVHDTGHVYTFEGPTAQAAITAAFPELAAEKFDTPIERDDRGEDDIPHFLRRRPKPQQGEPAVFVASDGTPSAVDPGDGADMTNSLFPNETEVPAASSVFD